MIFATFTMATASLLLGSWVGVLFATLVALGGDQWWAPVLGAALAVWFTPAIRSKFAPASTAVNVILTVVLLATLAFRVQNLGWSEFQGDEARALLIAERFSGGDVQGLFTHRKGPGEILTAAAALSVFGPESEFLIRLPFAVAGVAVLCAVATIIASATSPLWGIIGFLVIAQDGVLLGFARIVQYQMPMLLFSGAAWTLLLSGAWRWHAVWVGLFLGASLLCHYDAIFLALPALIFIAHASFNTRVLRGAALLATISSTVVAASFYIPFLLSPSFTSTQNYLAARAASVTLPAFNLPRWTTTWEIYSGSAASWLLVGLLLITIFRLKDLRSSILVGILIFAAGWLGLKESALLSSVLALALLAIVLYRLTPQPRIAAIIAMIPVFIFCYWFAKPNSHFLIASPALVTALVLSLSSSRRMLRYAIGTAIGAALILSIRHQQQLFFADRLERPRLRASVVEFGLGHRTGLRAAAEFLTDKGLSGSAITNDDHLVANWYLRSHNPPPSSGLPELLLLIQKPREPVVESLIAKDQYALIARVLIRDRRAVDIFRLKERIPAFSRPERVYDVMPVGRASG